MTGRTHDIISFAALLTLSSVAPPTSLNLYTAVSCMIGSVVGALLPDMDQASNRLWDLLPAGNFFGKIFRHLMLGHRTISHSLLGLYLIYKLLMLLIPKFINPVFVDTNLLVSSLMIGMVSHLFADALTKDGIPLFFPFKYKLGIPPLKSLRITTGKFVENFILFPVVLGYIFWLVYAKRETFVSILNLIRS